MAESTLPSDVQAFLHDRLESYEQLEVLLLLRTRRSDTWTPSAVGAELHMPELVAQQALEALCQQGLLSAALPDGQVFRYRPESAELDALVERLAEGYSHQRIEVVRLMTANAIERLRARALRTFANAFILGKKAAKDG